MHRSIETLLHLACTLAIVIAIGAFGDLAVAGEPGVSPRVDDRLVVRLANPEDPGAIDAFIEAFLAVPGNESLGLTAIDEVPGRGIVLLALDFPKGFDLAAIEQQFEAGIFAGHLIWGEFLYRDDAPEGGDGATGSTYVDSIAPPSFGSQYARTRLGLDAAHAASTGAAMVVAVLDTGVDPTHPVLAGAVLPGIDFVDPGGAALDTADGIDQDGDGVADELHGHGTFVAGIVRLVAPEARIFPVRVLNDEGRGDGWAIIAGMHAAIDRGVEVINVSIRSTNYSSAVDDAVEEAEQRGIVVVAAAGNFDLDRREYPAARSGVLGVVAVDEEDRKAAFSSYNDKMFICAPGDTDFGDAVPVPERAVIGPRPGGGYAAWEGTSFATPMVAGAAALIRAQHPQWTALEVVNEVRTRMELTAVDIAPQNPEYDPDVFGVGRLAVGDAVALGPPAPAVGDFDADGWVGFADLARLLADWGLVHSVADIDSSGRVDLGDLLLLLNAWG
ncbi:MAG: S8 family peptidase [Planctomycetota bacterium]|jgi:subtilisin family serine protease